jgi:glycolate oxidase FAD binding subunit
MLREGGGSVVILRFPETLRSKPDLWGCDSNALPLMREIKRQFDPDRTLNRGRFVGDI